MGYGYAETFLIVFLTQPGVIIPTMSSATSLLPPEYGQAIPADGFPPTLSGLWQTLWVWILSLPGEKSAGFGWDRMHMMYVVIIGY